MLSPPHRDERHQGNKGTNPLSPQRQGPLRQQLTKQGQLLMEAQSCGASATRFLFSSWAPSTLEQGGKFAAPDKGRLRHLPPASHELDRPARARKTPHLPSQQLYWLPRQPPLNKWKSSLTGPQGDLPNGRTALEEGAPQSGCSSAPTKQCIPLYVICVGFLQFVHPARGRTPGCVCVGGGTPRPSTDALCYPPAVLTAKDWATLLGFVVS